MVKRTIVASVLAAVALVAGGAPAAALPPPEPDTLWVTAYYQNSDKTRLVGQRWHGCGQPAGGWGVVTPDWIVFHPSCS